MDTDREGLTLAPVLIMSKLGHLDLTSSLCKVAARFGYLSRSLSALFWRNLLALRRRDQSSFFAVLDVDEKLGHERDT